MSFNSNNKNLVLKNIGLLALLYFCRLSPFLQERGSRLL